ncbi:hypothetical protein LguiA_018663 [Lonicera macranthoides]
MMSVHLMFNVVYKYGEQIPSFLRIGSHQQLIPEYMMEVLPMIQALRNHANEGFGIEKGGRG